MKFTYDEPDEPDELDELTPSTPPEPYDTSIELIDDQGLYEPRPND